MIIDCDCCAMQGTHACDDCLVTALFMPGPIEVDDEEEAALEALVEAGLVPRLRLVPKAG